MRQCREEPRKLMYLSFAPRQSSFESMFRNVHLPISEVVMIKNHYLLGFKGLLLHSQIILFFVT